MKYHKLVIFNTLITPILSYADIYSIQVKETFLRDKPSFLSKQTAKLTYAQQVDAKNKTNTWYLVTTKNANSNSKCNT